MKHKKTKVHEPEFAMPLPDDSSWLRVPMTEELTLVIRDFRFDPGAPGNVFDPPEDPEVEVVDAFWSAAGGDRYDGPKVGDDELESLLAVIPIYNAVLEAAQALAESEMERAYRAERIRDVLDEVEPIVEDVLLDTKLTRSQREELATRMSQDIARRVVDMLD